MTDQVLAHGRAPHVKEATKFPLKILLAGFAAGFIAVLVFHQAVLAALAASGFVAAKVYSLDPTAPFGVPQVISLAFWGGVWGVPLAAVLYRIRGARTYWIVALLFGAILPSLVFWFVVAPLKGLPIAADGDIHRLVTGLAVNGAWGIGTALVLWIVGRWTGQPVAAGVRRKSSRR